MGRKLDKLTIRGFKSIEDLEGLELGPLNVLIGANGAGKSNFVEFFRLLRAIVEQRLQAFVNENGPADGYFFDGVRRTKRIQAEMFFGPNCYRFELGPRSESGILIQSEESEYSESTSADILAAGSLESGLKNRKNRHGLTAPRGPNWYVWNAVSSWQVYHFHDTSKFAGMRRDGGIEQRGTLQASGENLAAFLLGLRDEHPTTYQAIRRTLQRVAPFFDDFVLSVRNGRSEDQVRLTWKQKHKDYIFSPGHLSDGTIRFLCLATALLQPSPPSTIVIDEPELGLHPEALTILAGLLRSTSTRTQIIAATQSPFLLSEFEPEDVITVDQADGATRFARLDVETLADWLKEFSLGELWLKGNVQGGINRA